MSYRIYPKRPQSILNVSESFSFYGARKSGRATLTITAGGEYLVSVYGDVTEGTVKRTDEYKRVEEKLTKQMLASFSAQQDAYIKVHAKTFLKLNSSFTIEKNVEKQKFYSRKVFQLAKPTKQEAQALLEKEAEAIAWNSKDAGFSKNEFVNKNLESTFQERIAAWNEIKVLFEDIESGNENKQNAIFRQQYENAVKEYEKILNGDKSIVERAITSLYASLDIPYMVEYDFKYDQASATVDVDLNFVEDPANCIPDNKVSVRATGKISVSAKTATEQAQDVSSAIVSTMYYMACNVFNITTHIQHVRIKSTQGVRKIGICWIDFDRSTFYKKTMRNVDALADLGSWRHVANLKLLKTTQRIDPMDPAIFESKISQVKDRPFFYE